MKVRLNMWNNKVFCHNCGKLGHKQYECYQQKQYSTTVECYGCRQQVVNLKEHTKNCPGKGKRKGRGKFKSTIKCYDCHEQVINLKEHRAVCPKSRLAKSVVTTVTKSLIPEDTKDFYMLLDVSSSMDGRRLKDAKKTLMGLFDIMNETDRISIVTFDTKAFFKLKPRPVGQIRRQNELPICMDRIFAKGMTSIWDAIYLTVEQIRDKNRKTLVIVLTDGEDNSSKHSYEQVEKLIAEYPNISLNIVHIDGKGAKNEQYAHLCEGRGEYAVIEETEIIVEITRIFVKYYR